MDGSLEALTREMSGERKAVFERVWRRVMGTLPAEDAPAEESAPPEAAEQDLPALPCPAEEAASDFPRDLGVLGENCLEYVPLLQGLLRGALEDWRIYQALAKRAGGGPGRALSSIAQEEKRRAKELNAVCFLISGARTWPDPEKASPVRSYLGALRSLFRREQETMAACLAGAELVGDPCLRDLLLRHGKEAWDHSCRVRSLVEQA